MLVQLDPSFDIQALESCVMLEAVNAAIEEVEDEVAIVQEGVVYEQTIDKDEATQGANTEETSGMARADVMVVKVGVIPDGGEAN